MKKDILGNFFIWYIFHGDQNMTQIDIFFKILVYFCPKNILIFFLHWLFLLFVRSFDVYSFLFW